MTKLIRRIFRFFTSSGLEKKLFFEALFLLYYMKLQISVYNFKTLANRYNIEVAESTTVKPTEAHKQIAWAVNAANRYLPWKGSCLLQALSVQRMCVKRGLHAAIYFGVKKDPETGTLKAHAWTKAGHRFLTGKSGHRSYAVVARFAW